MDKDVSSVKTVGDHYLVELNECDVNAINSEKVLREGMLQAVERSGATIIKDVFHSFSPHGVTGVIVIAESHVSIHTWPEHRYAAVDIFTCSAKMNVELIINELQRITQSGRFTSTRIARGPKTPGATI
jgi:S-adenosylmethionine decarboxylase